MHEEKLPSDLLAGHRSALGLLARVQMPAWLRRKLDPSDLVQQTMLEAHRERARLEALPLTDRAAYLRRCLCNNLIDAARKFKPNMAEVEVQNSSARIESWLAADISLPGERLAREERLQELAVALAALPENQCTAVELKHLQGLSVREIARQIGCTEVAVGGLLRRGVRELRSRLGADWGKNHGFSGDG